MVEKCLRHISESSSTTPFNKEILLKSCDSRYIHLLKFYILNFLLSSTNVPNILYNIHMKYYHYYYYMINRRSDRMMNFSRNFKKKNFDQSVNRIVTKLRSVAIFRRAKIGPAAEYFQQNVSAYYQNWSSHGRITRSPIVPWNAPWATSRLASDKWAKRSGIESHCSIMAASHKPWQLTKACKTCGHLLAPGNSSPAPSSRQ